MKNITFITLISVCITSFFSILMGTHASSSINLKYSNAQEFLQAEGDICSVATDGINVITVENGQFGISTLAYTPNPEYSCTQYKLSDNDTRFYFHTQAQLSENFLKKLENIVSQYESRMRMLKWSDERRGEVHQSKVDAIDKMISDLLIQYPQDIALPISVNNLYLKLTYIKLRLSILDL